MKKKKPNKNKKDENKAAFSKFHYKKKRDKKADDFDKKEKDSARYKQKAYDKPKLVLKAKKKNTKKNFVKKEKDSSPAPASHKNESQIIGNEEMRLNKYIAHCGICSRRKASEYIQDGEVKVNDEVVLEMGYKVKEGDIVKFRGKAVKPSRNFVYLLLNKPKNVITTLSDEKGRRTVADFIKEKTNERIYPVGRLDRNTTGLLVLTNDGNLAQKLSHPSYEVKKVYKATLDKPLTEEDLFKIQDTLQLEDGPAPVDAVEFAHPNQKVIGIELHIGRNRIVRRIFQHLGYEVVKLDRVRYSNLTKKNLPLGQSRFLSKKELLMLKHLV